MGLFSSLFGDGGAKKTAKAQTAGIAQGKTDAYGFLDQRLADATGQYAHASKFFDHIRTVAD